MTKLSLAAAVAAFTSLSVTHAASNDPVAGLAPWQRPAGAPVIKDFPQSAQWHATALHGVSQPYPAGLEFLDHQGAWHTPFDRPGMPGRYDLRGWHGAADARAPKR